MAKRKEETPPPGAPAWTATFGDLMNLLLCFFVLLFSMSTINADKFKAVAESFSQTFSIFNGGATAIGDGTLISNGVSQLNELDDNAEDFNEYDKMAQEIEKAQLQASEQLAERVTESIDESDLAGAITIDFTSQYVQLTLKGALLFDSGKAEIREDALPIVDKIGVILSKYAKGIIEIEGHTDNIPQNGTKYADNSELSCGRALAVFNYLVETTNLDPSHIKYSGRGEYLPIADNSTEEGRAKNRRVEIRIYNDLSNYE